MTQNRHAFEVFQFLCEVELFIDVDRLCTHFRSGEYVSIQSMDRHPHQPHLVALGREDGSLCFWDLRQERQPVQLIEGHSSDGKTSKRYNEINFYVDPCKQLLEVHTFNRSSNLICCHSLLFQFGR